MFSLLVIVALFSFLFSKYRVAEQMAESKKTNLFIEKKIITINNNEYQFSETNGKYKISINNEKSIYDILRNFKTCTISAGLPIDVSQEPQGHFKIVAKSTNIEHNEINDLYDIGDLIIGAGFIADGAEIGYKKNILIMKKDTNYLQSITYKVVPILYCFK